MASTLKRVKLQSIGTTPTALTTGTETTPGASKVWNIQRLYITNITASAVTVTLTHTTSAVNTNIIKGKSLAANDTVIIENIALLNGDTLILTSGTATSLDTFGSIVEEDI